MPMNPISTYNRAAGGNAARLAAERRRQEEIDMLPPPIPAGLPGADYGVPPSSPEIPAASAFAGYQDLAATPTSMPAGAFSLPLGVQYLMQPENEEVALPQIGTVGNRNPRTAAGLPPGKDLTVETQAPSQYAGPTQEESTVPLVQPTEEHADPENFRGRTQRSYQTPQEVSLGDWAKEVQGRAGPPKLAANQSVRTYTNKDLDEVVRENRGSVLQVHSSTTTDQDDLDVGRREAREGAEFAAGQSRLDAIIQDPTGEGAKDRQHQRGLETARAGGEARTRLDRTTLRMEALDADLEAAESDIEARAAAGQITPQQAQQQKQQLEVLYARELRAVRAAARQRQLRQYPEDTLLAPPPTDDSY